MTLQELIDSVLSDGVTPEEGQQVLSQAVASGASAEEISAMSGISVDEINNFIASTGIQGNLNQAPPPVVTPPPGNPSNQTPVNLPPVENLGNTFGGNFGTNPGALGFNDLNPVVTGADNVTQTAIPEFLKPFLAQSVDASQGAMTGLTQLLARDNALTSPFNDLQLQSQVGALNFANGNDGFLTQAQDVMREIADPEDIIQQYNDGRGLMQNASGMDALRGIADGSNVDQSAMNTLQGIAGGVDQNQIARSALESTAGGNFLYGGQGFNEAVQASIRQALPNIDSKFALQGGSGAVSGGLRDAAVAEVTADAFARQFGNERQNQLSAAYQLNSYGLDNATQRMNAANQMNSFGLANTGQQFNAASTLAGLDQNTGSSLINVANADRGRQFQAAGMLPQFGLMGSQITGQIGDSIQRQEERTKLGQVNAMQQLLQSSFGNINPNSLFGNINSVQQNSNSALSGLGGAMGGAQLGSMFGPTGTAIGAIGGGLLGAFG